MFAETDTSWAPWFVVNTDDKKRGRLNIISHLLGARALRAARAQDDQAAAAPDRPAASRTRPPAASGPGEVLSLHDRHDHQPHLDARSAPPGAGTRRTPEEVAEELGVDPAVGLSAEEAARRLQQYGPNRMAAKQTESGLHAFVRQYQDFMQILLLGAAIVNVLVTGEWGTTIVLLLLTVFNAVLSLRGEAKAAASVGALEKMLKNIARVRRDGEAIEIDSEGLVPGDIVLMEAGNRVPADGGSSWRRRSRSRRPRSPARASRPEGCRDHRRAGRRARRSALPRVHEHLGHAGTGRDDRHDDRHGHADRSHRRTPQQDRGRQDPAAEAARQADGDHRRHCRRRLRRHAPASASATTTPSTTSSSPASHSPSRRSRAGSRPSSRPCTRSGTRVARRLSARSSSACPRSRRSDRCPRSARTRPAPSRSTR